MEFSRFYILQPSVQKSVYFSFHIPFWSFFSSMFYFFFFFAFSFSPNFAIENIERKKNMTLFSLRGCSLLITMCLCLKRGDINTSDDRARFRLIASFIYFSQMYTTALLTIETLAFYLPKVWFFWGFLTTYFCCQIMLKVPLKQTTFFNAY